MHADHKLMIYFNLEYFQRIESKKIEYHVHFSNSRKSKINSCRFGKIMQLIETIER